MDLTKKIINFVNKHLGKDGRWIEYEDIDMQKVSEKIETLNSKEIKTLKSKPLSELSDREVQFLEGIGSCD